MDRIFGDPQGRNASVAWQPAPQGRGTLSILWTCILTMILCVWTALHLNVPPPEPLENSKLRTFVHRLLKTLRWITRQDVPAFDSDEVSDLCRRVRSFLIKIGWLLLGVFTPEVVVYTAASQFIESRKASRVGEATDGHSVTCKELSPTQMFFANMGGIVIDTREWQKQYLRAEKAKIWYLDPRMLELLLEYDPSIATQISERVIEDKSKTNALTRAIVFIQTLWFMAQCISRFAQPLPITLLEMNTFTHCLCASLVYILWGHKPLDVAEPIVLHAKSAHQFLAWRHCGTEFVAKMVLIEDEEKGSHDQVIPDVEHNRRDADSDAVIDLNPGDELLHTGFRLDPRIGENLLLGVVDTELWTLAAPVRHNFTRYSQVTSSYRGLSLLAPTNLGESLLPSERDRLVPTILIVSGIVYGGLHALAWNAPFRNSTEQLLWRISSITIMGYGPIFYLIVQAFVEMPFQSEDQADMFFAHWVALWTACKMLFSNPSGLSSEFGGVELWQTPFLVVGFILNTAYALARGYLIWESYWSLFHAVPGVFLTPRWADYYPHIG